ncbi:hypothetical protein OROMI_030405 [Orobanche minor]
MIPFNVVNSTFWKPAVEAIAEYGPGFKPPSMWELRTWILKAEVEDINNLKKEHVKAWKEYGCSIMSDGWTGGKSRCLVNFLVNSPHGTFFLRSIDASHTIKNGELMFKFLDDIVKEVGEEYVIQIITDSAPNMKNAGKRLMEKRQKLWWTPCAMHCIDLMLEDIGKMKVFDNTLQKAKKVVKFIYGHSIILAMMRGFTYDRELIRPAVTRFATAFLTLQCIYKQKRPLAIMFTSKEWEETTFSRTTEGLDTINIVLYDPNFWPHVAFCIKATVPLVCVLKEVDSEERPTMAFIYELMDKAKENIKANFNGAERKYQPIWRKIDSRWTPQLHQPLHAAGMSWRSNVHMVASLPRDDMIYWLRPLGDRSTQTVFMALDLAKLDNEQNFPDISPGADSAKSNVDKNCKNITTQADSSLNVHLNALSNDFSSTFILDEELELEQETYQPSTCINHLPWTGFDDEDDEIMVNDQAVEKLVIVTQNRQKGERPGEESKTICSELASAINDGLYFYEQLKSNRSSSRDNKPITGSRDEKPRCFAGDASVMNLRTVDCSTGEAAMKGMGILILEGSRTKAAPNCISFISSGSSLATSNLMEVGGTPMQ